MKSLIVVLFNVLIAASLLAQNKSLDGNIAILDKNNDTIHCTDHKFSYKQLILPVSLVGVGFVGLESGWLKYQNSEIRDELQEDIKSKFTVDNFTQYAPMFSVYALNLCGVKGKHRFRDRTVLLTVSFLLMGITTNTLKYTTKIRRPDSYSRNSFPSGHTAMSFMGAEFLRKEYHDEYPWIGVIGYAVAAGTGFFRMYNNKHWLTDVIAGAGIGILSTRASYWLYPSIRKILFGKKTNCDNDKYVMASPFISRDAMGLNCVIYF